MTVRQYASAVAEGRQDVEQAAADLAACNFPIRDCVVETAGPMGRATARLGDQLGAAFDLGLPPAEVSDLYRRTVDATDAVLDAVDRLDGTRCSNLSLRGPCDERYTRLQDAGARLARVLRGWDPYV